jgi:hypothetical protein
VGVSSLGSKQHEALSCFVVEVSELVLSSSGVSKLHDQNLDEKLHKLTQ